MQERLARSTSIGDLPRFGRLDQQALREMRAESSSGQGGVPTRALRRPDAVHRYNAEPMSPSASPPTVRLYNSLTRRVDPLEPITPGRVTIYTCGSTVYRYAHIGNLRTYLFGDLLRRTLQYLGYEVLYVKNITDVGHMRETGEDPILLAAEVEGKSPEQIAEFYTAAWLEDERLLNMAPADVMPKATDHISEMVAMTAELIERGLAYEVDGNVYYDVVGVPRLRPALRPAAGADEGRPSGRRGERQARSGGLRALEAGGARPRHEVAVTLGRGLSRLAHRVLGHVHEVPG